MSLGVFELDSSGRDSRVFESSVGFGSRIVLVDGTYDQSCHLFFGVVESVYSW